MKRIKFQQSYGFLSNIPYRIEHIGLAYSTTVDFCIYHSWDKCQGFYRHYVKTCKDDWFKICETYFGQLLMLKKYGLYFTKDKNDGRLIIVSDTTIGNVLTLGIDKIQEELH